MSALPERPTEFDRSEIIARVGRLWFWIGVGITCTMVSFTVAMFSGKLKQPLPEAMFTVIGCIALCATLLVAAFSFLSAVRAKMHAKHRRFRRILGVWLLSIHSWSNRATSGQGSLPHLGLGGTLVAAFVTSQFAASAASALLILFTYGWHGFFVEGLWVTDWKHGVMSNGQSFTLPVLGVMTFALWILFIGSVEWFADFIPTALKRFGSWGVPVSRLIGGASLYALACLLYACMEYPLFHPVPFSAFIGGVVLMAKGVIGLFRLFRSDHVA